MAQPIWFSSLHSVVPQQQWEDPLSGMGCLVALRHPSCRALPGSWLGADGRLLLPVVASLLVHAPLLALAHALVAHALPPAPLLPPLVKVLPYCGRYLLLPLLLHACLG